MTFHQYVGGEPPNVGESDAGESTTTTIARAVQDSGLADTGVEILFWLLIAGILIVTGWFLYNGRKGA